MKIFDDIQRTSVKAKTETESSFSFLNNSARPYCQQIRNVLQDWFDRYPEEAKLDLLAMMRGGDDDSFLSVFTELCLYELHRTNGCAVEIHPRTSQVDNKAPDFLVNYKGEKSYLEVKLVTVQPKARKSAELRAGIVRDIINAIDSPDYWLMTEEQGRPNTPPSASKLRAFIERELANLNYAELSSLAMESFEKLPNWIFEHDGWKIIFTPVPRSPKSRGKPEGNLIGATLFGVEVSNTWEAIRSAVTKKAGKYKGIASPFVIAVNVLDELDDIDIMDALFGKEESTYFTQDMSNPVLSRQPSGAWRDSSGPINTRVSAVLLMQSVLPWNFDNNRMILFHNPWAVLPYTGVLTSLPQRIPQQDGTISNVGGKQLHEMLKMEKGWLTGG